ncbi:helix-turn-helix transcriptional regulator [Serratia sp. 1D1416]|uniref:helix-turn-helix domain-containing protein n=1 Tax=Serratia sp. 1D1416 TaxID=2447890 RepID=UPI001013CA39|nr:helix-turn-helix transcriptional regulator [Serratia sp. 1D1416]
MSTTLTVMILDNNRFYAAGLQVTICQHFEMHNIELRFISASSQLRQPALVFFTPGAPFNLPFKLAADGVGGIRCLCLMDDKEGNALWEQPWLHYWDRRVDLPRAHEQLERHCRGVLQRCHEVSGIGVQLTLREREILRYVARGMSGACIGRILGVSEKTVSAHKRNAMRRLNLRNNQQLYRWISVVGGCEPV